MNYLVNGWLVQPELNRITTSETNIQLEPRTMRVLVCLIESGNKVMSRKQLLKLAWPNIEIGDDSLTQAIASIRNTFKNNLDSKEVVETVRKVGYRLIATVIEPRSDEEETFYENVKITGHTHKNKIVEPDHIPDSSPGSSNPSPYSGKVIAPKLSILTKRILVSTLLLTTSLGIILGKQFLTDLLMDSQTKVHQEQTGSILPANALAIMPFTDLSALGDQAYLANGLTEELMDSLSKVKGLRVAAKMSSLSTKNKGLSIPEAGKALNVGTIVEGSVRLDDSQVRISVQLVDVQNGFQLWSKTYQRKLEGLFELQDEISSSITSAILPKLSKKVLAFKESTLPYHNVKAYLQYLKGKDIIGTRTRTAITQAIEYFDSAVQIDPDFTAALVMLAQAKRMFYRINFDMDKALIVEADKLLARAQKIDPGNARIFYIKALLAKDNGNIKEAKVNLEKALELHPNNPDFNRTLGFLLTASNPIEAENLFTQAMQADPLNDNIRISYANYLTERGRIDEAIESVQLASTLNPNNALALLFICHLYLEDKGKIDIAIEALEKAIKLDKNDQDLVLTWKEIRLNLEMPVNQINKGVFDSEETNIDDSFAVLVQALAYLSNADNQGAMQMALSFFERKNAQPNFFTKEMLSRIITNQLLRNNQPKLAEQFLLNHYGLELNSILSLPAQTSYYDTFRRGKHLRTMLAYADILKILKKNDEYENVLTVLDKASLKNMKIYRRALRNKDYLVEAEIRAIKGDYNGALDMLERAVDAGFRFNWNFDMVYNYSFREINQHPRFIRLLELIQEDLKIQKNKLSKTTNLDLYL